MLNLIDPPIDHTTKHRHRGIVIDFCHLNTFTIDDLRQKINNKISKVAIYSRVNAAIKAGKVKIVACEKTAGRPKYVYQTIK